MCPGKVLSQNSENLVTAVIMYWTGMCVRILKYQFQFFYSVTLKYQNTIDADLASFQFAFCPFFFQ